MNKTFLSFFVVILFFSMLSAISNPGTNENRIGRPKDVTDEQISELRDEIVSNLQSALDSVKEGNSKQAISFLRLTLKNINTIVVWTGDAPLLSDAAESKKKVREAIKLLKKGELAKAEDLIGDSLVVWQNYDQ